MLPVFVAGGTTTAEPEILAALPVVLHAPLHIAPRSQKALVARSVLKRLLFQAAEGESSAMGIGTEELWIKGGEITLMIHTYNHEGVVQVIAANALVAANQLQHAPEFPNTQLFTCLVVELPEALLKPHVHRFKVLLLVDLPSIDP